MGLAELGDAIRRARRERGISRAKLAESIGMHPVNYAKIEQGKKNVTYETLFRIADGLGLQLTISIGQTVQPKSRRSTKRRTPKVS
jgi:UDP-N-acetylglucosamine 1-carboxyvinyltransferase